MTTVAGEDAVGCPHDRGELSIDECAAESCESCIEWLRDQDADWKVDEEQER